MIATRALTGGSISPEAEGRSRRRRAQCGVRLAASSQTDPQPPLCSRGSVARGCFAVRATRSPNPTPLARAHHATDKQSPLHWRLYSLFTAPSRSDGAPYNIPISKAPGGCEGSAASGASAPKSHRSPDYCPIRQFTIAPLPKETQRPRCVCHAQNCREMFHLLHPYYTISRGTSAALPGGPSLRDGPCKAESE